MPDSGAPDSYGEYIDEAPIGVFVVDDAGTYVDVNEAGCELVGYTREQLLGRSIEDLTVNDIVPAFQQLKQQEELQTERQVRHADGHTVPVAIDAVSLDDDRYLAYCQDISERWEYQQRLEESEARYRSMANALDTSSVGTFVLDSDFNVVWLSEAITEFFDITREGVVGADKAAKIESDIKHIFDEPDRFADTVIASYEDNSYVESFRCHVTAAENREERWLLHWSAPIEQGLYAGGRIEHYTDITGTVRHEHRIEEQRDKLRILNEMVTHDIRNDLQLILANAAFLDDTVDEAAQSYVETIRANAEDAVTITQTARETSDMMFTEQDSHAPVSLRDVLLDQLEAARETNPNAAVTAETPLPAVTVSANDMLGSVFRNLLQNAIRHTDGADPEVRVSATDRPDTVEIRIADNGPGIADEDKAKIFEKAETAIDSPGSGLGLYLVRTLIDSYNGAVWVEDRADDQSGAVFVVELPKAEL